MRIPENHSRRRRCGVTSVETAMVMLPLMLTMFSIFEYGRFVMVRHMLDLATEIGCRYAVANNTTTGTAPNIGTAPYNHDVITDVQTIVNQYMAGMNTTTHFSAPLTVTVYAVPSNTWDQTITNVTSTTWTVVPPSNTALIAASTSTLASINAIQPGYPIAVRASGNFKMMFPTLLYVSPQVPMNSMVILTCEGT